MVRTASLTLTFLLFATAGTALANDDFAGRINLGSSASVTTSGNNDGASLELDEPNPFFGDLSVWWEWTAPASGWVSVDTFGSEFDTVLHVFTGTAVNVLTTVVVGDDNEGGSQSEVRFFATIGVAYKIAVLGLDEFESGSISLAINQPVSAPPANDNFASTGNPTYQLSGGTAASSESNIGAGIELDAFGDPESNPLVGGASVWWEWTAPATDWVSIDTFGSDFDTLLYAFTGSALDNLSVVAVDDENGASSQSAVRFFATSGVSYKIAVNGFAGSQGSISLAVQQPVSAPPANDNFGNTIYLGSGVSATTTGNNIGAGIEIDDPDPLSRGGSSVWWSWTAPANGWVSVDTVDVATDFDTIVYVFTGSSLDDLTTVAADDDNLGTRLSDARFFATALTNYKIAVYGAGGASGSIHLGITPVAAPPGNNDFDSRTNLGGGATVTTSGSNVGAGIEIDEPDPLVGGGASVWWKWTAPATGPVQIDTFGSGFDTLLYVFTGDAVDDLTPVAVGDDNAGTNQGAVNFQATMGTTYQIAVHGSAGAQGSISLAIGVGTPLPANDLFANRLPLTSPLPLAAAGSNAGAGIEVGEPDPAEEGGASVWWEWTAPSAGYYRVDTAGSDFDTILYVFSGTSLTALTPLAFADSANGTPQAEVFFLAAAGESYQIAVHGDKGETGSISLAIDASAAPPANDTFAGRATLVSNDNTVSNTTAGIEIDEPDPLGGGASVWWEWTAPPGGGWFTVDTFGSNFDTLLYVFTGTVLDDLLSIGVADEAADTQQSSVTFLAAPGEVFQIAVHGDRGERGSINLSIAPGIPAPANDRFADRESLGSGGTGYSASRLTSNVSAGIENNEPDPLDRGGASVWWEWTSTTNGFFRVETFGSNIDTVLYVYRKDPGATGPVELTNLIVLGANDNAGGGEQSQVNFFANPGVTYYFAVHGNDGQTGSVEIVLGAGSPPPANDSFLFPVDLGTVSTATAAGSNNGATLETDEPNPLDGDASAWWKWTAPSTGYFQIDTFGSSNLDSILYVFTGTDLATLTLVGANDNSSDTNDALVNFFATSGVEYHLAVLGDKGDTGDISLNIGAGSAPPANDNFSSPAFLASSFSAFDTANNTAATLEVDEPDPRDGGASVWWEWTAPPGGGWVEFNTVGSDFDTVLYVFTGSVLNTLSLAASNDNAEGSSTSKVNFLATGGVVYKIAVHGDDGDSGSVVLNVLPGSPPPGNDHFASTSNPLYQLSGPSDAKAGTNAGATTEGPEPDPLGEGGASVWWRWTAPSTGYFQVDTLLSNFDTVLYVYTGTDLANLVPVGANNDGAGTNQSVVNFHAAAGTTYHFAVHGKRGVSGSIQLSLGAGVVPPGNDDFANAIPLPAASPTGTAGSNAGATLEFEVPEPDPLGEGGASVWWTWTAPSTGWFQVNTAGSSFDTVLYVYAGNSLSTLVLIGANDEATGINTSRVNFNATGGVTYCFAVHGDMGETGNIALNVDAGVVAPPNDPYAGRIDLGTVDYASTSGTNEGATRELDEITSISGTKASVWWSWTAPSSNPVKISTGASDFDTVLFVYEDAPSLNALDEIAADDDGGPGFTSEVEFTAAAGTTYHIAVHGSSGDTGNVGLLVTMLAPFETFMKRYPALTGSDALRLADPDSDGINNLTELALGLDPTTGSTPAGSDPNIGNVPAIMVNPATIELYYTVNAANLSGGVGLPIEVTGGATYDMLSFLEVIPVSLGGDSYKIAIPIVTPGPLEILAILVTDPNS